MKKSLFSLPALVLWLCLLCVACATKPPAEEPSAPVSPAPEPPESASQILEPEFSISSIAILQAELINTRFKVRLRVDNPNSFPLELSAFNYELYGAGRYWAEGRESGSLEIPPESHAEKDMFLLMNFINMKRDLLDQVIALKAVAYRFSGEATVRAVGAIGERLPPFVMRFDRSGESPVEQ
ncbi:MAG: LEA type 2 family protein [Treponema sp.]|jgi:LEA14-like dessication related protein|nr:LEA type 2 family protein [Treponema sp.]